MLDSVFEVYVGDDPDSRLKLTALMLNTQRGKELGGQPKGMVDIPSNRLF